MRFRTTLIWLAVALALLAFIVLHHLRRAPDGGQAREGVFPSIKPAEVNIVRVRPGEGLEVAVARTNGGWRLTEPLNWRAEDENIEHFLAGIGKLSPAAFITPAELNQRPNAEHEYGFDKPKASIILGSSKRSVHMLIGSLTPPGDQFFLEVVGSKGVFVLDSEFLKLIPSDLNAWRDRTLVDLNKLKFDRVNVTNGAKVFGLQRKTGEAWRLVFPIKARADQSRIHDALEKIHSLRAQDFVTDDPRQDLETYGLQPPLLELAFESNGTPVLDLQFGKLNNSNMVFARRDDWHTVVTVPNDFVSDWQRHLNEFREQFLLSSSLPVQSVSREGPQPFTLSWGTNGAWHIAPSNWPGDADLVKEFILALNALPIQEFVKDVTTAPDLPPYGLDAPTQKYSIVFNAAEGGTNGVELDFGATVDGKTYVRRTDEDSVYAVGADRVKALASAAWQLRERRLWRFALDDVKTVTVRHGEQVRELERKGAESWALAGSSQGIINDLAVEETVKGLANASVERWSALGSEHMAEFSITEDNVQLIIDLKNGQKVQAKFGRLTPSNGLFMAVELEGQVWIGELPWILCRDIAVHLAPPEKKS